MRWVRIAVCLTALVQLYSANSARLAGDYDRGIFWLLAVILAVLMLILDDAYRRRDE